VVGDRQRHGEVVGAARAAVEQLHAELRPGDDARDQRVIEHRELRRLEDAPADLGLDVRALLVPRPRAHHVARPDQLDGPASEHIDLAAHQALDDHESAVVDLGLERARDVPFARVEPLHARQRLVARTLELIVAEQLRELRVGVDDADHAWGHVRGHTHEVCARTRSLETRRPRRTVARPMELQPTTLAGARGLALRGELDLTGAPRIEEHVQSALLNSCGAFVLDLSELAFMDSSGVNALLRARSLLGRERRELVVVCPPGPVRRVLELIGVVDMLAPFASREEAAAALVPSD
jgi:anti-anti-sigma factor